MPRETDEERKARLATALRQNLRRRKARERQRVRPDGEDETRNKDSASSPPPSGKEPSNAG